MKLSRRERYMLTGGMVVAGLVILVTWIVVPLGRKWAELGEQLAPKLTRLEALQSRAERHGTLLARRARLTRQIGSLLAPAKPKDSEKKTPEKQPEPSTDPVNPPNAAQTAKPRLRSIEADLEKAAKESGVGIKVMSAMRVPLQTERLKHFKVAALRVEADSNIESLMKLLHKLEKGERFVRVDMLKIRQDLNKPGALSITLEILAYEPADGA